MVPSKRVDVLPHKWNLIGNAIKYHSQSPPVVRISAEQRKNEWIFAVADNGIGIEPEHHQTIFGVFKRLHGKAVRALALRSVSAWSSATVAGFGSSRK